MCSSFNAHTEPLFKELQILKMEDLFSLSKYKFYYNYCQKKLPSYYNSIDFSPTADVHPYNTRNQRNLFIPRVNHSFADSSIKFSIPKFINQAPKIIIEKIYTHSFKGFCNYIKKWYLDRYSFECMIPHCYICSRDN